MSSELSNILFDMKAFKTLPSTQGAVQNQQELVWQQVILLL